MLYEVPEYEVLEVVGATYVLLLVVPEVLAPLPVTHVIADTEKIGLIITATNIIQKINLK